MFCVLERRLQRRLGDRMWVSHVAAVCLLVGETALYSQMDAYPTVGWALYHPLHIIVSITSVVCLWTQMDGCRSTARYIRWGLALIVAAFTCWLVDMFACEATQHLHLHAFGWHLLSAAAIAAMHCALACQICRHNDVAEVSLFGVPVGVAATSRDKAA